MAGQIGEYISSGKIADWTKLSELAGVTFDASKKYTILNNSGTTCRFCASTTADPEFYGSNLIQNSVIFYSPKAGDLYIKGSNFNLAISEV